jgi:NADPH-dependent 2,4-dienoyl-CoA reductase/sulfur reductase-like enzyme
VPLAHVFGERIGAYMKTLLEGKGVTLLLGRTPKEISGPAGAKTVTLSDGTHLSAGFVVIGLGIQPAVDWLAGTGLVEEGAVPVDEQLRTRAADVFAAGDIAAVPDREWGRRRVEHWIVAQRHGARVAAVMLGQDPGMPEVDVFWTKLGGASLKSVGSTRGHEEIIYRGSVEEGKFLAGFFRKGKLTAAATLAMPQDLVAVERLLRLGAPPTRAQFQDGGFDLVKAARAV